jgi:DNA invertase Pin-like site-specific DNA recombinase
MSTTIAYVRVSTDRQDVENQRLEILKLVNDKGLGKVDFVEETISGRTSWRDRRLAGVIDGLEAGDSLIVSELSRLGRSMLEIMEILSVATQRRVHVYASKGNWVLDGSMQSKIIAMVLAMAAEIERTLISERTRAALATKKAAGVRLGRPKGPGKSKLDQHETEIRELLDLGLTKKRLAERLGTTPANLRHWMKRRKIEIRRTGVPKERR